MPGNNISILWAHPRSMSTAMERLMRERGDCKCLHEPFMYYYYLHLSKREMPFFSVDPAQPFTFEDIIALLLDQGQTRAVFAKDMAYYVVPEIFSHPELATRFQHAFLVRDPVRSIVSYFQLDPQITSEEVGINAQWQLFKWLRKIRGESPLILLTDRVQSQPAVAVKLWWQYLGLSDKPDALQWQNRQMPDDWQQVASWHQKTIRTKSINKDTVDTEAAREKFEALVKQHPSVKILLAEHLSAYQGLRKVGEAQWQACQTEHEETYI